MELVEAEHEINQAERKPNNWEIISLGELSESIIGGGTPSRSNPAYWGNEIPWVTVKDFATFRSDQTQEYITSDGLRNSSSNLIPRGTVITSTRMALGKAIIYDVNVCINQDLKAIFFKSKAHTQYMFYWFQFYGKRIEELGSGSTVMGISLSDLRKLSVLLPPAHEQRAIATALSEVDALISSLDKLIEKKKAIKQGAMQELLTPPDQGGKRLEGFDGKWEEVLLGKMCELITKGTTPTSLGKSFTEKGVTFIKAESINNIGSVNMEKVAFIDMETNDLLERSKLKEGDILFSIAGVLGRVGMITSENLPANTNQAVAIIRLLRKNRVYLKFFFHLLNTNSIAEHIESISVQGAQANFSLTDVSNIPLSIPSTYEEQKAIADILSDINSEIQKLESKKNKYKLIKQGMMQELLTGKTRLL